MRERVRERGSERLYDDIELPLAAVLASMEDAGVRMDDYRMGEITARLRDRLEELEARAYELAGEEFMLGSTQQVARILFEKLELTPGRKGKTGYSTDTRVLRSIRGDHEIVGVIEEWREYSKLLNPYLEPLPSLISETDGRLHTTFNQAVAATGRLSTSNPNLQAIPIRTELGREIRSAFVAEPGSRLLSADYSQVELRILAHVSGEPKLREAFARGDDIHRATAAEVLGKDPATLTTGERAIAKMINFGIVYGISAFGLSVISWGRRGGGGGPGCARSSAGSGGAPPRSTRRSPSTSASATTGTTPSPDAPPRVPASRGRRSPPAARMAPA